MKKWLFTLLAICMFCVSLPMTTMETKAATTTTIKIRGTFKNDAANESVKLINKERKELGLTSLKLDSDLTKTAKQRAAEIAVNFDYNHNRPDGTSFRTVGNKVYVEIICAIYSSDPKDAVDIWHDSKPHHDVYTTGAYNTAGAACFSQGMTHYWVMHFGIGNLKTLEKLPNTQEKVTSVKIKKADYNPYVYCPSTFEAGQMFDVDVSGVNPGLGTMYVIDAKIKCTSTNSKIIKINSKNRVYGIRAGKAKIKITGDITKTVNVEVGSEYKVRFGLYGGTLDSYQAREYSYVMPLRKATKEGYFFQGWYLESNYKTKVTNLYYGEDKVFAKWGKVKVDDMENVKVTSSNNKIKVTYSKNEKADGYQIYYSRSKHFTDAKKDLLEKGSYVSSKLVKGRTYYVKMRAYRLDSAGKRVYGKFSTPIKVKIQ